MTFNALLRKWHILIGTILAAPIVIIAITAVLMAHNQNLDLRNIPMDLTWLPGYQNNAQEIPKLEVRSTLTTQDQRYFIGTRFGLWELKNNQLEEIAEVPEVEIRSIKETSTGLILASRKGVWMSRDNHWKKVFKGDSWEVEVFPDQTLRIATKNKGFLESKDGGKHWTPLKSLNNLPYVLPHGAPQEEMNLGRLVLDLHTGRAFWGKQWGWAWIDLAALLLAFITLSGVMMKVRAKGKKPVAVLETRDHPLALTH